MSKYFKNLLPYYKDNNSALFLSDTFTALEQMKSESVDMIFADPPYFLSNDGITCSAGKMVSVNKGDWDKVSTLEEKHTFNRAWIKLCKNVLNGIVNIGSVKIMQG
jgi:site-specific DNA-methyltransferase (adenine-specific)